MSFGKMNKFIEIKSIQNVKDDDGFSTKQEVTIAKVRGYREGRHGSEKWRNSNKTKWNSTKIRNRKNNGKSKRNKIPIAVFFIVLSPFSGRMPKAEAAAKTQ